MNLNGKRVYLPQLEQELAAAGVTVRGLGIDADDLHTYTAQGAVADVPAAAAAVVTAHVPPDITPPDYGSDAPGLDVGTVRTWVQNTRTYLALGTPTAAQTTAQVQRNARAILALVRLVTGT